MYVYSTYVVYNIICVGRYQFECQNSKIISTIKTNILLCLIRQYRVNKKKATLLSNNDII